MKLVNIPSGQVGEFSVSRDTLSGNLKGLSEREVRSLKRLKVPEWWLSPVRHNFQAGCLPDIPLKGMSGDSHLQSGNTLHEDQPNPEVLNLGRHHTHSKVLLGVGSFRSFSHLPGVGTRWQRGLRQEPCIARRYQLLQLLRAVFSVFLPTLYRKLWISSLVCSPPSPPTPKGAMPRMKTTLLSEI